MTILNKFQVKREREKDHTLRKCGIKKKKKVTDFLQGFGGFVKKKKKKKEIGTKAMNSKMK